MHRHNRQEHALGPEVAPGLLVQLQILGFLSFFLFLAITLFAERRRISAGRTLLLSAAGFVLLAALILSAPGRFEPDNPMVLLLGPGLVLLIMVAPFLAAKVENAAFWDFNRAGWLGAALGFLAALIVNLGLVFAIGAIEELFGLDMPSEIYGDTMTLCYGLIWPWLALGAVPRSFESPEGDYCPRWISFIIGNILVPLVVVYLAILYAFMAKILIQWQLPRG